MSLRECDDSEAVLCHSRVILWSHLSPLSSAMGKLNIAHHKSYHPYRRDNIERVRKDEEEARRKEESEDGRMMLAVSSHDTVTHVVRLDSKDRYIRTLKLVLIYYEKSQLYWINQKRRRDDETTTT